MFQDKQPPGAEFLRQFAWAGHLLLTGHGRSGEDKVKALRTLVDIVKYIHLETAAVRIAAGWLSTDEVNDPVFFHDTKIRKRPAEASS